MAEEIQKSGQVTFDSRDVGTWKNRFIIWIEILIISVENIIVFFSLVRKCRFFKSLTKFSGFVVLAFGLFTVRRQICITECRVFYRERIHVVHDNIRIINIYYYLVNFFCVAL
eukprot:Lithocolla_globosa_v1_NODE_1464_length_2557_cov_5.754996.p2 type:complete len:113 gc:universal NODE_1464_length_2557_cov_5.754996:1991-2329(+)